MAEGIKLYKHFIDQINLIGKPKRAWFTTFNFDVHFFEKYILSALLGLPYKDLKNSYDYESLNDQLAQDANILDDDKLEVKVFYDYRALHLGNKPKQTTIQLHPIDIKEVNGLNPNINFVDGVFHPKVILIETVTSEYWLMVSSANLTFGGWSNNRECFFCEKIKDKTIAREVGQFFMGITNSIRGFKDNTLLAKLTSGKFGGNESRWKFFSSFSKKRFLDQLNPYNEPSSLSVWSPYFADDLPSVIQNMRDDGYFDEINIVPAKNEIQKIRITKESFLACLNQGDVTFKQDRLPLLAQDSFVHAKVWLTPHALAIGSWNMTHSGMNSSSKANNNIEAGIIYSLNEKMFKKILDHNVTIPLKAFSHYDKAELEKEKEEILNPYIISVDLIADWDSLTIKLVNPTYNKFIKQFDEDCIVTLPGIGIRRINILENEVSFRGYQTDLLTDRMFEVQDHSGKPMFRGYIREIGLANRPVNSFGSIDDYLKGWVLERPEDKQEMHRLSYKVEEEFGDELSEQTRKILYSNDQNAWFTSFHAFECIIKRIDKAFINYKYKKEQIAELKRIGRVLPGSLSELRKHLCELKVSLEKDKSNFIKSPIYLWFLIEKANTVFKYFNDKICLQEEYIERIKNLSLNQLLTKQQLDELGEAKLIKWIGYIRTKLRNNAYQS